MGKSLGAFGRTERQAALAGEDVGLEEAEEEKQKVNTRELIDRQRILIILFPRVTESRYKKVFSTGMPCMHLAEYDHSNRQRGVKTKSRFTT